VLRLEVVAPRDGMLPRLAALAQDLDCIGVAAALERLVEDEVESGEAGPCPRTWQRTRDPPGQWARMSRMRYFTNSSARSMSPFRSQKATSGSIIQNSEAWRDVWEFSARKVGPNV